MSKEQKQIINHISRLEGQLASVKKELSEQKPDCVKASTTLLSASRSFAGLRQSFTRSFLRAYFINKVAKKDEAKLESLVALIKG